VLIQHTAVGDNGGQKTKISAIIVKFIMTCKMRDTLKSPTGHNSCENEKWSRICVLFARAGSETHPQL
jgi:hypothetical protein